MTANIRPAEPRDADALFRLVRELAITYKPTRDAFDASFHRILDSGHQLLLVAETERTINGYVMATESATLYANGPTTELMELIVEEPQRSGGLGRLLVQAVIEWARSRHCIEVNVPSRRAGAYYVSLGFEEAAPRYRYKL